MKLTKNKGLPVLNVQLPEFNVSDDTVMHLATARALVETQSKGFESCCQILAREYVVCFGDMVWLFDSGFAGWSSAGCDYRNVYFPVER